MIVLDDFAHETAFEIMIHLIDSGESSTCLERVGLGH